jgi:hypothetical protein
MAILFKKNKNNTGVDSNINSLTVGMKLITCSECEKYNKGIELYNMFQQAPYRGFLLKYDRDNETFLINEDMLMRAIQLVTPLQRPRKLRLVSRDEFFSKDRTRNCKETVASRAEKPT